MKQTVKVLGILGLTAAFLVMATAMVIPHAHHQNTPHHACWLCQSKGISVDAPQPNLKIVPLMFVSLAPRAKDSDFRVFLSIRLPESRAPPGL